MGEFAGMANGGIVFRASFHALRAAPETSKARRTVFTISANITLIGYSKLCGMSRDRVSPSTGG